MAHASSHNEEAALIHERLASLEAEKAALEARLTEIRNLPTALKDVLPSAGPITNRSSARDKIALFRSLFRGREDVYPKRWDNARTGKAGYAPVCANEWTPRICGKPRVKCGACPSQAFREVMDEAVDGHLRGSHTIGVYPMLPDDTCRFLAADFDKASWRRDAGAFLEACRSKGVPAALERSRSGNGGHVWIFFTEPVPAALARRLGAHLVTETMERNPDIGFESYDRFFPSQDTVPAGGFGNLIALPLQGGPREGGNSVFLDDSFEAPCRPVGVSLVHAPPLPGRGDCHRRRGRPAGPGCRSAFAARRRGRRTLERAAVAVPAAARDCRTAAGADRHGSGRPDLHPARQFAAKTGQPAHPSRRLPEPGLLQRPGDAALHLRHPTHHRLRRVAFSPHRPASRLRRGDGGVAGRTAHPHGHARRAQSRQSGGNDLSRKPDPGTAIRYRCTAAARDRRARGGDRVRQDSHCGGRRKPGGIVDVGIIQSLVRKGEVDDIVADYGHLVVDECHHISAVSFEAVVRRAKAKYVLGLSATVTRRDGHHPIVFTQCGPVRFRTSAKAQARQRPFAHRAILRPTDFRLPAGVDAERPPIQHVYAALAADEDRNDIIFDDVLQALEAGRSPIPLTERKDHAHRLAERLVRFARNVLVLRGGMGTRQRREIMQCLEDIPETEERVLIATGRYVGEGFDDARLDTLFLTIPISWKGTLAQYVGRLHRLHAAKREVLVHDYVDHAVPTLMRMSEKRDRGYESLGYSVERSGAASPEIAGNNLLSRPRPPEVR